MAQRFGSYREQRNGEDEQSSKQDRDAGSTIKQDTGEASESYFDARQEMADAQQASEVSLRQETEPVHLLPLRPKQRPGNVQRRGTSRFGRLAGVKRRPTGAQASDNPHDPFQYTFDPLSSGSESSSSSNEENTVEQEKVNVQKDVQGQTERPGREQQRHTLSKEPSVKDEERKGQSYSRFAVGNDLFKTKGRVSKRDGRLKITISETANSGYVAKALGQSIRNHLNVPSRGKKHKRHSKAEDIAENDVQDADSADSTLPKTIPRPRLNIVIMVIGSRGDIQPFLQIGRILKHKHGHRVRIASHPTFREFVEKDAGLEFFSVGGDPSELMAFMVKNPGLIPSLQTVREGEIQRRRNAMATMFDGFWRACVHTTDDPKDEANLKLVGGKSPFIVDAIIANPPSMAHVHVAEKLGVPLHIMFTFPYTPTIQFPHPLANIKARRHNVDAGYVNFMSYPLVEMMTWQGLGDIVNKFREKTLDLEPVSSLWAPGALYRMKVPYTYLWSPSLVPKPEDWGPEVDLAGYVFLDLASDFKPPKDLLDFLDSGEPPVYVGFGSIVVDDPNKFTDLIFKAAELAGVRVLVNKGWGGLGHDNNNTPKNVYMLGNTPHDWLFPRVKAVVHHGGAGTTAIGLKLGKPTMIVPFFGDQPFWGARLAEAKAGAHECIRYKKLTAERLAEGIKQCLTEEAQRNVQKIAESIANEGDGAENAVLSFHRSLPLTGHGSMRCSILQDRVAVWGVKKSSLRLCPLAAEVLQQQGKVHWNQLKLIRHYEWNDFDGPGGPFTGGAGALSSSLYEVGAGFGMVPMRIAKHLQQREELERKKRERMRRREERQRRIAERALSNTGNDIQGSNGSAAADRPTAMRQETAATEASAISADAAQPLRRQLLGDFGSGVKRSGAALLTMPNDFSLAIAQGFHNAPRLYGDATVRKPIRITGVKSGCLAARKEFQHGVSDAWTGLITQPKGDWEDGDTLPAKFAGLGTGIGKGLGGFVLKGVSSVVSPPAFIGQGVIKSIESWSRGPGSTAYIRRAHVMQGQDDLHALQSQRAAEDGRDVMTDVEHRVMHGWGVYEQLWAGVQVVNSSPIGKIRLRRERKHWNANGALDSVDAAEKALQAVKDGKDIDTVLARHRKELSEAEQPRASAMEHGGTRDEVQGGLPREHVFGSDADGRPRFEPGRDDQVLMGTRGEGASAETVVATPGEVSRSEERAVAAPDRREAGVVGADASTTTVQ